MRALQWGKFSSQATDIVAREICGESIVIDQLSTNTDNGGPLDAYISMGKYNTGGKHGLKTLMKVSMGSIRGIVGHTPVLLRATLNLWLKEYGTYFHGAEFGMYRMLKTPNFTNATYRNLDNAVPTRWTNDGYSPLPGTDVASTPFSRLQVPYRTNGGDTGYLDAWDITTELSYVLRRGTDMMFMAAYSGGILGALDNGVDVVFYKDTAGKLPYLELLFLFPVEFYKANLDGTINLAGLIDNTSGQDTDLLDLGSVERGGLSQAVKCFAKNFRTLAFPTLEVWDDSPEWTIPTQTAGTGIGKLDYVSLADTGVSQQYDVLFSSATAFEVKATAYRDNVTGLHTAYNGAAAWLGSTAGDWTAPSGGLTIPAAAWQPGTATGDSFQFFVLGQSTDSTWPADSNDQVEITFDDGGAPDDANWRPICGQRTKSVSAVTIDATTKKVSTPALASALWPIGNKAFICDDTNINYGEVASVDVAALGSATHTGAGLADFSRQGVFNGVDDRAVRVEIDSTGATDTFKWSVDGGSNWVETGVEITGDWQLLQEGIWVKFTGTTGHTSTDHWDFTATSWGVNLSGLTADSNAYAAGAKVGTTLPLRSVGVSIWARTNAAGGHSSTNANRLYFADTAGFQGGQLVQIQDAVTLSLTESATISSVTGTYLVFSANLTNDYASGALVIAAGVGDAPFWMRAHASAVTTEEQKRIRFNVRG